MAEHLFLFLQLEFPWELGPPDGRYLLRAHTDADPERVVVLGTLGAGVRTGWRERRSRRARRGRPVEPEPEATSVPTSRVTIIDPTPVAAERQAKAWLRELDVEHAVRRELAVLNRVLHMHRLSAADPYVHEVSPEQALTIRAGWGEGEHVADGRWLFARELHVPDPDGSRPRRRRGGGRVAALRSQERFAELLGARTKALACEEFALRARIDLDHGRVELAEAEVANAYAAALRELREEALPELAIRLSELEALAPAIAPGLARAHARAAPQSTYTHPRPPTPARPPASAPAPAPAPAEHEGLEQPPSSAGDPPARTDDEPREQAQGNSASKPDEETLRHALERLEAALRARAAALGRA